MRLQALAPLLLALVASELRADSLTLTTWYPAPYGIYSQLRTTGNTYLANAGGNVGIGTSNPTYKLDVNGFINATGYYQGGQPLGLPAGTVVMFAGAVAPGGWLLCDGSAVSRASYAGLFSAIGTTYGAGDGSTTFNLPDMRGRAPVGAGQGFGLTNRPVGQTGGEERHTLTIAEMPSHTHDVNYHLRENYSFTGVGVAGEVTDPAGGDYPMTALATGGGQAHNVMQPFLAVNCIIKH